MYGQLLCHIGLFFLSTILSVATEEYYIKSGSLPSYLYYKSDDPTSSIIDYNFRINVSLSRISGTLLYTIDKYNHQLILSLHDALHPTLGVELNEEQFFVSLSKLCNCVTCKYEKLNLHVQINTEIFLRCNGHPPTKFSYQWINKTNKDYPIPNITTAMHLWLVNTQHYGDVFPNNVQLAGCIFNVMYNNTRIIFTKITDNIERKCTKICIGDICNNGQCFETYNSAPICDCTNSFFNGPYCNDSITPMNLRSVDQYFIFNMFKVSWQSSVYEIFTLKNKNVQIQLHQANETLYFEYKFSTEQSLSTISHSMKGFVANTKSIFIVGFSENTVDIRLHNNRNWNNRTVIVHRDLRKEVFSAIILRSGVGIIDFVYKSEPNQHRWMKLNIIKYDALDSNNIQNNSVTDKAEICSSIGSQKTGHEKDYTWWITAVVILSALCIISSIGFITLLTKNINRDRKKMKKCSEPLLERLITTITTVSEETDIIIGGK